jgi:hypothetical protein
VVAEATDDTDDVPNDPGCYGTVLVGCGQALQFYFNNGQYDYKVVSRRMGLLTGADEAETDLPTVASSPLVVSGRGVADAASSSTLREGVKEAASSSLRGGAKKE